MKTYTRKQVQKLISLAFLKGQEFTMQQIIKQHPLKAYNNKGEQHEEGYKNYSKKQN